MLIAIHQPNYLPWPGFFHKWRVADALVILDTVQYHKNEWQNRNRIKGVNGVQWLTVPVHYRFGQLISEVAIAGRGWVRKQIAAMRQNYARAPFFADCWPPLEEVLLRAVDEGWHLSRLNIALIRALGVQLGCRAPLCIASEMAATSEDPTQRLIDLCKSLGGDAYLSGAEGRNYLRREVFAQQGMRLCFQQVEAPRYPQLHGAFASHLSVVDLLCNVGPGSEEVVRAMGGVVDV